MLAGNSFVQPHDFDVQLTNAFASIRGRARPSTRIEGWAEVIVTLDVGGQHDPRTMASANSAPRYDPSGHAGHRGIPATETQSNSIVG